MPYAINIESYQHQPVFKVADRWDIRITNEDTDEIIGWDIVVRRIDKLVSFYDDAMNTMLCCRKAKKYVGNKEGVKLLLKHRGLAFEVMLFSSRQDLFLPVPPPAPVQKAIPAHFIAEFMEMSLQLKREHNCPCCFEAVTKDTIHLTTCGHILCKSCFERVKQTNPVCPTCRQTV
jgi:hypothetical protein